MICSISDHTIQLNYNDECLMHITAYILSNKRYSSHRCRQNYQLILHATGVDNKGNFGF